MKATILLEIPGGMDNWDLLIPTDTAAYTALSTLRAPLFTQYDNASFPRDLTTLEDTALTPANNSGDGDELDGGRSWSLSPQMPDLADLFNAGNMSIVADVGPLLKPVTKAEVLAATIGTDIPNKLFSHNDQQAWVQSLAVDGGASAGIAGRMNDLLREKLTLASGHERMDRVAFGSSLFLAAASDAAFRLTSQGVAALFRIGGPTAEPSGSFPVHRAAHLAFWDGDDHYAPRGLLEASLYADRGALAENAVTLSTWMGETPPAPNAAYAPAFSTGSTYYDNLFGAIMNMLVRSASETPISGGLNHQFFHIRGGLSGVDSHNDQATSVPPYQTLLNNALKALWDDLVATGLEDDVLIVVATEFGRTITPNSSGTDHAWGGYQFFIGGDGLLGGQGGKIIGGTPASPAFDPTDSSNLSVPWIYSPRGYMIPKNSIEQSFANIGYHMGLTASEMATGIGAVAPALPLLPEFIPGGGDLEDAVLPIIAAPGS